MPRAPETKGSEGRLGSCYGFRVRSSFPLRYVRSPAAEDDAPALEVAEGEVRGPGAASELVQTWEAVPDRRPPTRLFREDRAFTVEFGASTRFRVEPGRGRILAPTAAPESLKAVRRETLLWMTPAGLAVRHRGYLAIHAAAVEVEGKAALVVAPGGSGKSSTAAAFWAAGHRVLADDFSCCRSGGEEEPVVFPGPALIRLRPDAVEHLTLDDVRVTARTPGRRHLALEGARRGGGDGVPLAGIFLLETNVGPTRLTWVSAEQAIRDLWAMSFYLPEAADRARCFRGLGGLVGRVPVWRISRELRWEKLPEVVDRIAGRLAKS